MFKNKSFGMYLVKDKEGKYIYIDTKLKKQPFLYTNPFYSKEIKTGKVHLNNDFFEGNGYLLSSIMCERILNSEFFQKHAEEIYKLLEEEHKTVQFERKEKIEKKLELRRKKKRV